MRYIGFFHTYLSIFSYFGKGFFYSVQRKQKNRKINVYLVDNKQLQYPLKVICIDLILSMILKEVTKLLILQVQFSSN